MSVECGPITAEPLCTSHFGLDYKNITSPPHPFAPNRDERLRQLRDGGYEFCDGGYEICVEELRAGFIGPLPQFPERLRWWLRQLTTSGMRTVVAVEDLGPLSTKVRAVMCLGCGFGLSACINMPGTF